MAFRLLVYLDKIRVLLREKKGQEPCELLFIEVVPLYYDL